MNRQTIHDFYETLAGRSNVGAGCAAAVTALVGTGVLQKAALHMDKEQLAAKLAELAGQLEQYINEDAAVMEQALPKLLSMRPDADSEAWNKTLLAAAVVPQKLMDTVLKVLEAARILAADADMNLLCDIRAGAMMCNSALESAALLADMNLSLLNCDFEEKQDSLWQLEDKRNQAAEFLDDVIGLE